MKTLIVLFVIKHFLTLNLVLLVVKSQHDRTVAITSRPPQGPVLKAVIKKKLYRCLTYSLTSFQDVMRMDLAEIGRQCLENSQKREDGSEDGRYAR